MPADVLGPWLLTYLLHSTLLLASTWAAVRLWRTMPVALQETLWRTALFGGLLTASLQVAIGWEPWSGHLTVPSLSEAEASLVPAVEPAITAVEPIVEPLPHIDTPLLATPPTTTVSAPTRALEAGTVLALTWLAVLVLFALRAVRARRTLRRRLASRVPVQGAALRDALNALLARSRFRRRVRLTESADLGSPVAFGVLRPEIVVPTRAVGELSAGQLEAMLAHELAHHVRRDPLWFAVTRAVTTLLFFQPLHLVAQRRLRETSELLCDAWAADTTGRGEALAECLAVVAGWMIRHAKPLAVPAMAARGRMLERRVAVLLEGTAPSRRARLLAGLALVPLALVILFAPAVAAPTAALPEPDAETAPAPDSGDELADLDRELTALRDDLTRLMSLVQQLPDPPDALRHGVSRLAARLKTLEVRRVALLRDAQEMKR
ncbi:MAG: M56 family metallopeptidase [Planctomycetota bacterium]|nr:M56 family metallopeptidase [Planctomycetota bacterium]